jgi:hypothetical protein
MIAYIETKITRIFGRVPSCKAECWFASPFSDAIASGRFDETITTYEEIDCCDALDVDQEVKRRREKLIELYTDKSVRFDVRSIPERQYNFVCKKDKEFERLFLI